MSGNEKIGFIGVGFMGHGMAKNIVEKGYALTVLGHRNRGPVDDLVGRGAQEAKSPAELAKQCDIIFLCVTGSPQIEALVNGPDGIKQGAHSGLIIVDCSTADPVSTLKLAADLEPLGVHFADAPLGGTPAQAEAGQLSTMIGASADVFTRIKPVCAAWAAKIEHIGQVGDGHKMKLLNNFLSLGYAAIYAEALTLARKTGISVETFDRVLRGSRMDCGFYQTFMAYALGHDPAPHKFTLANAAKDLRYLAALANASDVANPVGSAVKNSFAASVAAGHGGDFVPTLTDFVAAANGVKVRPD
ncbi:NAD(P)-dependent oxidoreductase [Methylovirgula sp. 4M-Z18]|uniref:NAD(P)-dependent oxidoreductase n=1 Tax=Methylovirgula sp. 4M-Z18 TaxID=2293567 RepID=UPI000E2EB205|nr:NAD(P)-dependent oxidoreductase [Methylovirgula sp. 4M-Z18]RFB76336.1 NAD(P)-dependent oxidoreductase [Methylovirgula sp. 4M-Z18]